MLTLPAATRRRIGLLGALAALALAAWPPGSAVAGHAYGGPFHLSDLNAGFSERHIHFDDRTDSSWPVGAAANDWNQSSKLLVTRLGCAGAEYCPIVNQVNASYWGRAFLGLNNESTHFTRGSSFYINLSNAAPTNRRREVACQEEGHLLGLDHRSSSAPSCMWGGGTAVADGHDFSALFSVYSHNDP